MSRRGIVAAMTIEAATDADIFAAYVEPVLCPKLQPGDVVILDNLSAHKFPGIEDSITSAGRGSSICSPTRRT